VNVGLSWIYDRGFTGISKHSSDSTYRTEFSAFENRLKKEE